MHVASLLTIQPVVWRCSPSHSNKLCSEEASLQAEASLLMTCVWRALVLFEHEDIWVWLLKGSVHSYSTVGRVGSEAWHSGFALIKGTGLWWMLFIRHARVGLRECTLGYQGKDSENKNRERERGKERKWDMLLRCKVSNIIQQYGNTSSL